MMSELEEDMLKIIAICDYEPINGSGPSIEEAINAAPGVAFQLPFTRGQILKVVGTEVMSWWLFVKGVQDQDEGYIPSAYFIPLRRDLSPKEFQEFMAGGSIPQSAVNTDVDLRFFPDAPQERSLIGKKRCPRESANLLSKLLFWWINGLIITGYKRPLEERDLWQLSETERSSRLVPKFQQEWKKEQARLKKSKKHKVQTESETAHLKLESEEVSFSVSTSTTQPRPSLVRPLVTVYGPFLTVGILTKLCADIFMFLQPQLLRMLIDYVEDQNEEDWKGYVYMLCMVFAAILQFTFHQHSIHISFLSGMRIGTSLMGLVYTKALSLSSTSKKQCTTGEVVNLMAIDAQRIVQFVNTIHQLWSAPVQICVAIYFLYVLMGPSILAGVAVLLLLVPLNFVITRITRKLQVKQLKCKDDRVKLISEVLSGIKVLKLFAWEEAFMDKITAIRKAEVGHLTRSMYLHASVLFSFICAPFLVSLATFAVYVMVGEQLTATKAFVAISLFNILRFPLAVFPRNIISLIQAQVSLSRLTEFLNLDELDPENVTQAMPAHVSSMAVHMQHGAFAWGKEEPPIIENINLNIPTGTLVAVVGQVGCGKSTLLSALLGETEKLDGVVYVKGSTAYVPQLAWIQNATLQDNITFGKMMDSRRYKEVLRACALMPDIKILPAGDMTEIGEKGINLSGGQKQRVSLARAVYFNADVYLLDDPLSAVDSHVGKHIFDKVIGPNGMLKGKTRIMVTHGVQFLRQVDQIVVLQSGKISEVGTYSELLANQGAFAEFLNTYDTDNNGQEKVPPALQAVAAVRSGSTTSGISAAATDSPAAARKVMSCHHLQAAAEGLPPDADPSASNIKGKMRAKSETHLAEPRRFRTWTFRSDRPQSPGSPSSKPLYCRELSIPRSVLSLESLGPGTEVELEAEMVSLEEVGVDEEEEGLSVVVTPTLKEDGVFVDDEEGDGEEAKDTSKLTGGGDKTAQEKKDKEKGKLIGTELTETGKVKFSVVKAYANSVGLLLSFAILFTALLAEALLVSSRIWLAGWSSANVTSDSTRDHYLGGYGGLGLGNALGVLTGAMLISYGCMKAAKTLHNNLLINILHCPMAYFETTPLGRIVNRFSRDIYMIDDSIPRTLNMFLRTMLTMFGTVFVISYSTPLFLTVVLPLAGLYVFIQRVYVATSRQLRRLESVSRSPVYSHFLESITGTSVIRAFKQQKRFMLDSNSRIDAAQMANYPLICSNRWLGLRLEFIGAAILLFAGLFGVINRRSIPPGLLGLSIAYALQVTGILTWLVRQSSDLESNIVAVERVKEYTEIKTEAVWIIPDRRPPAEWPQEGRIDVENLELRYRDDLPLVIKDLTFEIGSGEKIGIVGRTGAGKSTLSLALFRILERAGGRIVIDNIDVTKIGLQDLRSRLTVIPQDAILFSGSLRLNLDPFDNYSDEELWRVLEVVHLKSFVANLQDGLLHAVLEGGENLSAGQRQLVCLARALLRKSKVLVLDEATAAVDLETDELIQSTIRTEFADRTVLTIAHRLNTIMDCTRIMVLDKGSIVEFDTPSILLARKQIFYQMAKDAGLA